MVYLELKAWIYQHSLLPKVTWPVMLYEITPTSVEKLEKIMNRYPRK